MRNGLTGQPAAVLAATRTGLYALGLLAMLALAACTTVEGTNALTDVGTFEREVMTSTARGFGLVPGEEPKEDLTQARAPLVLPRDASALPAPTVSTARAQLPADSDTVQIDTSNLTEADLARLRNARVVDLRSLSGRPLTEAEARALTTRMQAGGMAVSTNARRPLYLPPDEYFTRIGNADLICRTPAGTLVPINDPSCPEEVRRALRASNLGAPTSGGALSTSVPGSTSTFGPE